MKDYETLSLSKNEYKTYFEEQEKNDVWTTVRTRELFAVPLENNQLNLYLEGAFKVTLPNGYFVNGFAPSVTDDEIRTSMETVKTSVAVPMDSADKWELYPLRYTAFSHLQDRAGISGRSINGLKDRPRVKELSPEKRCSILNEGLILYNDQTNVLIRDGKVTSLLSGDENDYAIMPVIRLIKILENEMTSFSQFELTSAQVSHELASLVYRLHDDGLEKQIIKTLAANGQLVQRVEVSIMLTTSDVGLCAARVTPIIKVDGVILPIGSAKSVEHKGGSKAMSLFCDIAHVVLANYRKNMDNLNQLLNVEIQNPISCLDNVVKAIGLVGYGAALKDIRERIISEHTDTCSGYDIYWYLLNALIEQEEINKQKGKPTSLYTSMKAQDIVSQILFMNLKEYDY